MTIRITNKLSPFRLCTHNTPGADGRLFNFIMNKLLVKFSQFLKFKKLKLIFLKMFLEPVGSDGGGFKHFGC